MALRVWEVVKTVPLDIPFNFSIGALLMMLASKQIRIEKPPMFGKYFFTAIGCSAWFGLITAYFYLKQPDWMLSYFIDSKEIETWVGLLMFESAILFAGASGAVFAQALIMADKWKLALIPTVYGFMANGVIMFFTLDRYKHVGTFEQYYAGTAPLIEDLEGFQTIMIISGPLIAIVPVIVGIKFLLDGRKLNAAETA